MIVSLAVCVDQATDWQVQVQEAGVLLFPIVVNGLGTKLEKGKGIPIPNEGSQTITLTPGVYLLSTGLTLQYSQPASVRVQIMGGKDPWPPPPPAPQGSPLATTYSELYTKENLRALGPAAAENRAWIEVKGVQAPKVAAARAQALAASAPRRVEAVLLALEKTPGMEDSPRAPMLVSEVTDLLNHLVDQRDLSVVPLANERATKEALVDALRAARERLAASAASAAGLLVLAFSGHGGKTDEGHTWQLTDGPLSDTELAATLTTLPANVEVVLISDCCYGVGILRPGVNWDGEVIPIPEALHRLLTSPADVSKQSSLEHLLSDALRRRLVPMPEDLQGLREKLRTSVARLALASGPDGHAASRSTLCLASASMTLSPDGTRTNRFAQCLRAVMESTSPPPPRSYDVLDDEMEKLLRTRGEQYAEQHLWIVEAEPAAAAELPPFAPFAR
jgi:Caspase domain